MRSSSVLVRLLLLGLASVPPTGGLAAAADEPSGRLVGVVRDATGAGVPAARVEVRSAPAESVRSVLADARGRYAFDALPAGPCSVAASAPGFARVVRKDVPVSGNAESEADFVLELAPREAFVEVTARATERPLVIETDPRAPRQPIPAHDGADYLKTIPGFSVIRKGGTDGDPILRGMAGSRLGLLLDGENVLGGCGNRMDPPTAYAFPEAYERITVVKGPQTVVHGPGNSAGVVLFEKERPRFDSPQLQVYASPTLGSFGRNDQVADVRAGARKGYVQASASRSAMDDYEDGSGQAVHSGYERWAVSGAAGWTPDRATRIEVSGTRSDGEAAYADRAMDGVKFARENVGLRLERRAVAPWLESVEAQAFYNYVDHVMDNYSLRTFKRSATMPNPSVSNPDRRTVGGRALAALHLGARTSARVGADWQDNRHSVRSSSNQTADPFESHPRAEDATFENGGLFAELTRETAATARVVAGARVDRWSGRDERQRVSMGMGTTTANPTAGLKREETLPSGFLRYEHGLSSGATLFAGVGHSRRAPDYWELVSKESASSLSAFETRPERTTQLDAGLLFRAGAVSGSVSAFASTISDFILIESGYGKKAAGTGGMGGMTTATRKTTVTRNVDASSWGGEATLAWTPAPRLKIDGSLAYVRGTNATDDRPLAQLPPLEGRIAAQYATDRWAIAGLARLVAAQDRYATGQGNVVGQDLGPTSAFSVLSVNGSCRLARGLRLAAGADNVLDTAYAEFVSRGGADVAGFTTTTRVNEPGRTLWVKLDLRR
ncbi:MAG: TonB-dependent copper receptor [Vicinamibacteria bacterium]